MQIKVTAHTVCTVANIVNQQGEVKKGLDFHLATERKIGIILLSQVDERELPRTFTPIYKITYLMCKQSFKRASLMYFSLP